MKVPIQCSVLIQGSPTDVIPKYQQVFSEVCDALETANLPGIPRERRLHLHFPKDATYGDDLLDYDFTYVVRYTCNCSNMVRVKGIPSEWVCDDEVFMVRGVCAHHKVQYSGEFEQWSKQSTYSGKV